MFGIYPAENPLISSTVMVNATIRIKIEILSTHFRNVLK
jgi:hypothetical protein